MMLLPRMLLHRPFSGGLIARDKLLPSVVSFTGSVEFVAMPVSFVMRGLQCPDDGPDARGNIWTNEQPELARRPLRPREPLTPDLLAHPICVRPESYWENVRDDNRALAPSFGRQEVSAPYLPCV